jgi:deazaflavin-dependent oxidoreductase (nitroreductase family)
MSESNKLKRNIAKHVVNPVLRHVVHSSHGPFALLCHVGRKSGKRYEIPIMVWRVKDGFIIVLTYGREVDWLRNLQASGGGSLRWHKREYQFGKPEFVGPKRALPALPMFIRRVLKILGAHDYVILPTNL